MSRRRRRWEKVSWWCSGIFVLAIVLLAGTMMFGGAAAETSLQVKVFDSATGKTLSGAMVRAGQASNETNADGVAKMALPANNSVVTVEMNGYAPVYGAYSSNFKHVQTVSLRPLTGGPSEANAAAAVAAAPTQTAEPAAVETPASQTAVDSTATAQSASNAAGLTGAVSGVVLGEKGAKLADAAILSDQTLVHTAADGSFTLESAPASGKIRVSDAGYKDAIIDAGSGLSVQLERQDIKAVYLNGTLAGDDATVDRFIDLIDRTELNAVVIDIKENIVFYDTKVAFFKDAGVVEPNYDPAAVIKKFHDHGIYVIARQVVFKDPMVAAYYPDLSVKDDNGGLWKGAGGESWVNPFQKGLWQPNIDLALEAASLGFDEIQFDYIRFPSDGDLSTADFGPDYSEDARVGAIVSFLTEAHNQLELTGAKLAVDVFGIVAVYADDQGIGQRLVDIAPVVDYMCPMVYPSHFDPTSIDVGGEPNDHPYETVSLALSLLAKRIPGMEYKIRPWLQDFSLSGMTDYGPDQVKAQIKAAEETGSGWLLWNEGGDFTEDALINDTGPNS